MSHIEAEKLFKIGQEYYEKKDYLKAQNYFSKILKFNPENLSVLRKIALCYFYANKLEQTELILKKIIKIKINEPNALSMLIFILEEQDKIDESINYIDLGLKEKLLDEHWKIKKKLILPAIFEDSKNIDNIREKLNNNLDEILESKKKFSFSIDSHLIKPAQFDLSYDQYNNLEINKKCVKVFRKIYPELNKIYVPPKSTNNKIKIGFISDYLTDHTIGKLFKGIILKLDKSKFEIILFHTNKTKKGKIYDDFINAEKKSIIKNYKLPNKFLDRQNIISKENLDILFYPEIGLSLELYYLSFIKLAKYQITSWGHPETTGNHAIDYFLSSELIESENSNKNFSEKLLCAKYLPMYYYTPIVKDKISKEELSKNNIYSCPQTLFKIHPEFDLVIGKILKEDKKGILYFIKDLKNTYYKKLLNRFKKNKDIDIERVRFLDGLNWESYINHCGQASVLLDPLYFGAGNSFYESMFYGTPTVTKPTNYTKSRLVLGAYKQMELKNAPIVNTLEEYVDTAIKIANDKNLYDLKNYYNSKAKEKLFEYKLSIPDLEKIFTNIVS